MFVSDILHSLCCIQLVLLANYFACTGHKNTPLKIQFGASNYQTSLISHSPTFISCGLWCYCIFHCSRSCICTCLHYEKKCSEHPFRPAIWPNANKSVSLIVGLSRSQSNGTDLLSMLHRIMSLFCNRRNLLHWFNLLSFSLQLNFVYIYEVGKKIGREFVIKRIPSGLDIQKIVQIFFLNFDIFPIFIQYRRNGRPYQQPLSIISTYRIRCYGDRCQVDQHCHDKMESNENVSIKMHTYTIHDHSNCYTCTYVWSPCIS